THLLLSLFQLLLAQLGPGKAQVARGRDQAQADRTPLRQEHGLTETVVSLALQQARDRRVRQVAGGDDVRRSAVKLEAATARLRQVHFQERAKAILQLGERVDGFDGASAVRPARAGARRKRDHEYLAAFERSATDALVG